MGILQKYFTINIDNTESKFLDHDKLVQFYGSVSLEHPDFLPRCSKCQSVTKGSIDANRNPYIQAV
jgi:NAD-dependent SIR2 family protein deacetylase